MGKSLGDYAAMTGQTVEQCSGKWEQLEQAQTTVLANADRAYITAGLSANRYMEQVTGFSASLVKIARRRHGQGRPSMPTRQWST